jgi:flagellar hook-associated protein 1 FlgK
VINAAQSMAQQLNATSQGIQSLRNSAELGLTNSVSMANNALAQIANINKQLQEASGRPPPLLRCSISVTSTSRNCRN